MERIDATSAPVGPNAKELAHRIQRCSASQQIRNRQSCLQAAAGRTTRTRLRSKQWRDSVKLLHSIAVAGFLAAASTQPVAAVDISGAGATFPYPLYAKWADAYKKETGVGMNYQSIGSGGGIRQIKSKTV